MRDTVTEYGLVLVGCVVAGIMIFGVMTLFKDSGIWQNFLEMYASAVYGS